MKTFRHILPLLILLLPACQRQEEAPALVEYTLYASMPSDEDPATRTVVDGTNDKKILWSARESISVLYGGGNYEFVGNNTEVAASAAFSGEAPAGMENYFALYPYNESASVSGGYVSTSLPASQTGNAGSFADGYLITADDATGNSISFNHICSGLRFQVNANNIKSVSIRGNNGEKIAGNFRFRFTGPDTPSVEAGSEEIVTLTAPNGHFETGTYYYIVILPTVFTKGFTLTADNGTQVGELSFTSEVTFACGKFKNITGNLDGRMTWSAPKSQAYYGPQNSFCIRPGESISFDASPKKITGVWQRSGLAATADVPNACAVLWGNATATLSGTTLTVSSASAGSSLVAIKKGETILWSYLIWATTEKPEDKALGGNCYFQWGRKDPLRNGCGYVDNQGDNGLSYSILHPDTFINDGLNGNDWFTNSLATRDSELWGESGAKTVWDPCPAGYRVPPKDVYSSITVSDLSHFEGLGYIGTKAQYNNYDNSDYFYWTRTTDNGLSWHLRSNTTPADPVLTTNHRFAAMPIRCVKE